MKSTVRNSKSKPRMVDVDERLEKLVKILVGHGARTIKIFGSYARGEARPDSDLDVIVEFNEVKSLLELVGIEQELEDKLGIKVDLLTEGFISPHIIEEIEKECKVILDGARITKVTMNHTS